MNDSAHKHYEHLCGLLVREMLSHNNNDPIQDLDHIMVKTWVLGVDSM